MINRREFLGITAGAGASLALTPQLLRALQQQRGTLIQRSIPSSGEMLPVVGLTLANHAGCADPAALKEVVKTLVANGGRVFDAMQQSLSAAERATFAIVTELGIQNKLFFSWPGTPPGPPQSGGAALVKAHVETVLANLKVPKLDLVMVGRGDPTQLAALKEMKAQGLVRYIGVQTGASAAYAALEPIMRNEPIDFIGLHYAVDKRGPEETILPLAQERKIGVMSYFPFGGAEGLSCTGGRGLFARGNNTPLPDWAAEFDAKTWAQFFLKYVISHPAVTVARVGTTKAAHMLDNIGGGVGRLPNETTRKRMAAFILALPVPPPPPNPAAAPGIALPVAVLERYVGEYRAASGFTAVFRRDGDKLFLKPGPNPEVALNARSETRFQDPRGPIFEFQLDGQGMVTGVVLEQGTQRTPLERK